ncbi:hypothetical protein BDR05DRAFT_629709 [Suillus weaverae]|nr:hypothetical protein BDR05DRAFT_629709 [Suillus weaverae]
MNSSRRLLPSDRTNFGLPQICIVSCFCWKNSFLRRPKQPLVRGLMRSSSALLQCLILNMEHVVPATTISPSSLRTLGEFADYTAIVADERDAPLFLASSRLGYLKTLRMSSGFFVTEAKRHDLLDHIAQAVCEMYACGKYLEKKLIRSALTNGPVRKSVFRYYEDPDGRLVIPGPWPDLIAAILSNWIQNSFVDLKSDDWFEVVPRRR